MKKLTKISDLKAASYNPRVIKEEAFKGLQGSLKKFGDLSGIVYNSRTGNLVSGHQRLKALQVAGATEIKDGAIIDPQTGERFTVRVVDWSEAKEKAANVTANNQSIAGQWDDSIGQLLDEIKESGEAEGAGIEGVLKSLGLGKTAEGRDREKMVKVKIFLVDPASWVDHKNKIINHFNEIGVVWELEE